MSKITPHINQCIIRDVIDFLVDNKHDADVFDEVVELYKVIDLLDVVQPKNNNNGELD